MAARTAAFKAVVDALKARGKTTTVVERVAAAVSVLRARSHRAIIALFTCAAHCY